MGYEAKYDTVALPISIKMGVRITQLGPLAKNVLKRSGTPNSAGVDGVMPTVGATGTGSSERTQSGPSALMLWWVAEKERRMRASRVQL